MSARKQLHINALNLNKKVGEQRPIIDMYGRKCKKKLVLTNKLVILEKVDVKLKLFFL